MENHSGATYAYQSNSIASYIVRYTLRTETRTMATLIQDEEPQEYIFWRYSFILDLTSIVS